MVPIRQSVARREGVPTLGESRYWFAFLDWRCSATGGQDYHSDNRSLAKGLDIALDKIRSWTDDRRAAWPAAGVGGDKRVGWHVRSTFMD